MAGSVELWVWKLGWRWLQCYLRYRMVRATEDGYLYMTPIPFGQCWRIMADLERLEEHLRHLLFHV